MMRYGKSSQRGAAAAISIFLLMVVIAGMLTTSLYSSSSSIGNSIQTQDRMKALYLAESALERAQYAINQASNCGDAITAQTAFSTGTFEITASSSVAGGCLITVTGINNGVVAEFSRSVMFGSVSPCGSGTFLDDFSPDATDFSTYWTTTVTGKKNQGDTIWSAENAAGSAGGSYDTFAKSLSKPEQYMGHSERSLTDGGLPVTIDTTGCATPLDVTYSFNYMSAAPSAPPTQDFTIILFDSTGATADLQVYTSKNNIVFDNAMTWNVMAPGIVTVPAGSTYDSLRVEFNIKANKNSETHIWLDDINLSW